MKREVKLDPFFSDQPPMKFCGGAQKAPAQRKDRRLRH